MTEVPQPPAAPIPVPQQPSTPLKPHRGGVVLTLGILGLAVCVICGIIAWIMGKNDLREMAEGRMDPAGMGMTKAGKICGMISVILTLVGFGIGLLMLVIYLAAAAG